MDDASSMTSGWLRNQWCNPGDIFTLLMIVGHDVVRVAIAQLCMSAVPYLNPVCFSFGWVSYAFSAMLSAVGSGRLMPKPELDCQIINANTGYARNNHSYVIARILRDFDYWKDPECAQVEAKHLAEAQQLEKDGRQARVPLRVTVWKGSAASGWATGDMVYWSGLVVAALQLALAAVPFCIYAEWLPFAATCCGTGLAFASSTLPQWAEEHSGPPTRRLNPDGDNPARHPLKDVYLTQGNGSHDAILIRGTDGLLDLEDMASPFRSLDSAQETRITSFILAGLWIALLISVAGWETHTWYLLGVGIMGTMQNTFVAAKKRNPKAFGINLKYEGTIVGTKVMEVLWKVEIAHPKAGEALVETFFPGKLRDREVELWAWAKKRQKSLGLSREGAEPLAMPEWFVASGQPPGAPIIADRNTGEPDASLGAAATTPNAGTISDMV